MNAIKYLLDEHVDPDLKRALKKGWHDIVVWRIGEPGAPPLGSPDPDLLTWCEVNEFILVTNNRASMPVHLRDHLAAERHVPGIFVLNPKMKLGETAEELALIWGARISRQHVVLATELVGRQINRFVRFTRP
jgi:hypothetical protein